MPTTQKPIQHEVSAELQAAGNYNQSIAKCKQIISSIENITGRRTITYFSAALNKPAAFINDEDSVQMEDLLRVPNTKPGLDLILHSHGGYAVSAERIINVCRNYVRRNSIKEFRVIVPRLAKSAATIVSLGADKILLCDNAELGPVDPQMILVDKDGKQFPKPGFQIVKAVSELMKGVNSTSASKNEKYLTFLRQYNYDIYTSANNELELSKNIVEKISKRLQKKHKDLTYEAFSIFTDPSKTFSHGRLIGIEDLHDQPLSKAKFIEDMREHFSARGGDHLSAAQIQELDELIWELYVRKTLLVNDNGNPQIKVIEDNDYFFITGDQDWKPLTPVQPATPQPPAQP